jgi:hypothetical protein
MDPCDRGGAITYRSSPNGNYMPDQRASVSDDPGTLNGPAYQSGNNQAQALMLGQRSSTLIGTQVKLSDGQVVGRLEDIVISDTGTVDYMLVSFTGSEFGGRLAAIPWTAGRMDFRTRAVTLDVDRAKLRQAPIFFSRGRSFPNFYDAQWAANVYGFFGIESDIDRRIERAYSSPDRRESREGERAEQRNTPSRDERLRSKPAPKPAPAEPGRDNGAREEERARQNLNGAPPSKDENRTKTDSFENRSSPKKADQDLPPVPADSRKKDRDDQLPPEERN